MGLMAVGFGISTLIPAATMLAPAVFAFGLIAVGFLAMGPVTIAVDSARMITDNAQSVYEPVDDRDPARHHRGDRTRLRLLPRLGRCRSGCWS